MLKIYDYRCEAGHVAEQMVRDPADILPCPECGEPSKRIITPIRCKLDHSFPGEALKWAKKHEDEGRMKHGRLTDSVDA